MNEQDLRQMIDGVRSGRMDRRSFVRRLAAFGIAAPIATQLLTHSGVAMAQTATQIVSAYKATKRGGGGPLKVLWWQAATLLNPHFATGTKMPTAAASSTNRWPHGTATATSSRSWPPWSRRARMAAWPQTANLSPGS